jgi:hypothetical protein
MININKFQPIKKTKEKMKIYKEGQGLKASNNKVRRDHIDYYLLITKLIIK